MIIEKSTIDMKKKYKAPKFNVVILDTRDIIATSGRLGFGEGGGTGSVGARMGRWDDEE